MMRIIKIFVILIILGLAGGRAWSEPSQPLPKPGMDLEALREIAILDGGRKKPLDTFARESVRSITGRENFAGFDPLELLLSWMTRGYEWEKIPILDVDFVPLQKQLNLKVKDGKIAPKKLREDPEFTLYLQTVASRQQDGQKLTELERNAALLNERMALFYRIADGSALTLVPNTTGDWESFLDISQRYPKISFSETAPTLDARIAAGIQGLLTVYDQGDTARFGQIGWILKNLLQQKGQLSGNYPSQKSLQLEVNFNRWRPFHWAWMIYVLAFFIFLLSYGVKGRWCYWVAMSIFVGAVAIHAFGFVLRILISGRAPVTNMYETVIWVPFGMAVFALILESIYRKRVYAIAASAVAALGLLLAESSPGILNPSINPLVPVLRSNYWLTVHVLTITLSYGAFTLALGVANINAGIYIFKPKRKDLTKRLNFFIYRAIQIGVVFLAAGTILGGVWANASWGRFWGWDPKEVWALITLLGYLALLHGRYAGWIREFGLTVGAMVCYLLVMMAWYGVNFILGVGLHSYGFSSGGAKFVSIFSSIEFFWLILATLRYKWLRKDNISGPSSPLPSS